MTGSVAIILAAGRGSRLGPRTRLKPKCLVRLGGKALLDWQIAALRIACIDDIRLVAGYRADMLRNPELTEVVVNHEWSASGPVKSLLCAQPHRIRGDFLVAYGDCVFDPSVLSALLESTADIAVATDEQWKVLWSARFEDIYSDAERFRHQDGALVEIGRRASVEDDVQGQFMGLLKFSPRGWRQVTDVMQGLSGGTVDTMDITTLLSQLLASNVRIETVVTHGGWCEIDSAADLIAYRKLLRRRSWSHDWRRGMAAL